MSMHISAAPGEVAENVILPGDPLRARYIAEKYLEGAVRVNEIRNTWGYTGTYKGQRVSVMSTGMGAPSMLIYATELCREYGCKKLIRLGTAGATQEHIRLGDIILSQGVSTTSAINDYALPGRFAPIADFGLLDRAYHLFATMSSDEFKKGQKNNPSPLKEEGIYVIRTIICLPFSVSIKSPPKGHKKSTAEAMLLKPYC